MNDSLTNLWARHETYLYSLKALNPRDPEFDSSLIQQLIQLRKTNLFIVELLRVQWEKESSIFHQCWEPRLFELATCLHWMISSKGKKYTKVIKLKVQLNPFLSSTRINGKTAFLRGRNRYLPSSLKTRPAPLALQMNAHQEELCSSLGSFLYSIYERRHQQEIPPPPSITETVQIRGVVDDQVVTIVSTEEHELSRCLKQWRCKISQLRRYRCLVWTLHRRIQRAVRRLRSMSFISL